MKMVTSFTTWFFVIFYCVLFLFRSVFFSCLLLFWNLSFWLGARGEALFGGILRRNISQLFCLPWCFGGLGPFWAKIYSSANYPVWYQRKQCRHMKMGWHSRGAKKAARALFPTPSSPSGIALGLRHFKGPLQNLFDGSGGAFPGNLLCLLLSRCIV